jgi:hypothetical protein
MISSRSLSLDLHSCDKAAVGSMAVGSKPSWCQAGSYNLLRKNGVGETRRIE